MLYPSIGENMDFLNHEMKDINKLHFIGEKKIFFVGIFQKKDFSILKKHS